MQTVATDRRAGAWRPFAPESIIDPAVRAAIARGVVAVVAIFDTCSHKLVTATSNRTVVQARIRLYLVAVVTRLDALRDHSITATLNRAVVTAAVRVYVVAIVAELIAAD